MKIALKTINPVHVIDKSKKPWEMNGNKGVVYTAICHQKVDDEVQVEKIRITEEVYHMLEPMKEYHFSLTLDVKNNRAEAYHAYPATADEKGNTANTATADEKGSTANTATANTTTGKASSASK